MTPNIHIPARWVTLAAGAAIAAAALAVYSNSFSGPFVLDDIPGIVQNPTIRHLADALHPPLNTTANGRPVLNLTLALNFLAGGLSVTGYHAVNVAIHVLAGLALFGIVRRSARPAHADLLAFSTALLWTVHPLQTESVTYVIQRAESLTALFYLLTLYFFIRYASGAGGAWAVASIASCLLGMAAKEVMVSAPLIVLLYDRAFVAGSVTGAWRLRGRYYAGLASSWVLLAFLMANTGGRNGTAGFSAGVAWSDYALTQFRAITLYLRLAAWPHPLIFDYGKALVGSVREVLPQMAWVGLLLAGVFVAFRRNSRLGFAGVCFFAILAPTSSFVPIATETIAEHRMYLPLAALIAAIVFGVHGAIQKTAGSLPEWARGALVLGLAVIVSAVLGAETRARNRDYSSDLLLWTDTVAKAPQNSQAWCNRGIVLSRMGRIGDALSDFANAVRLDPDNAEAQNGFGVALAGVRRLPEAISHYEAAVRIHPDYAEAYNNLGAALMDAGRASEAAERYTRALALNPDYALAEDNLGLALAAMGKVEEAGRHFASALRIDPAMGRAHRHWGIALAHADRWSEAIGHYRAALKIDLQDPATHTDLGIALARSGKLADAVSEFEWASRLQPDSAAAHRNLALALQSAGRLREAEEEFREEKRVGSSAPPAH